MELKGCKKMECFLKCDLIDAASREHSILRCNPSFLNRAWRDWVMVEWTNRSGATYQNAAQLCLIFAISKFDNPSFQKELYIIVHPLSSIKRPPMHKNLHGCLIDTLATNLECIASASIASVTIVLPSCGLPHEDSGKPDEAFPNDQSLNRNFIIIPPRSQWHVFLNEILK